MDEIKKRIDKLEEERNNQLRYDYMDRELKRLYAIQASNKLRDMEENKLSKEKNLHAIQSESKKLDEQRNQLRDEIKKLEDEKQKFMEEVNAYNQAKASIDSELATAMHQSEAANSKLATNTRRKSNIESRLPEIQTELTSLHEKRFILDSQISELKNSIALVNESKKNTNVQLASTDSEINQVLREQSQISTNKLKVDEKVRNLSSSLNDARLSISKLEQERADIQNKIEQNSSKITSFAQEKERLIGLEQKLRQVRAGHETVINDLKSRLAGLGDKRAKVEKDIEETSIILEKASKAATQYEAKIKVVKEVMHEDYSIAKLKEDSKRLGIRGLVYELLSWDKQYERPILATGSDWLKALVVNDFATLLGISEFAQQKKLPKIKIIPLSTSVDGLVESLELLKRFIQNKKNHLKKIEKVARSLENRYSSSETGLANVDLSLTDVKSKSKTIVISQEQLSSRISQLCRRVEHILVDLAKAESYVASLEERISLTKENYAEEGQERVANVLTTLNEKKVTLLGVQSSVSTEFRELTTRLTELSNEENYLKASMKLFCQEQSSLSHEKHDLEVESRALAKEKENLDSMLIPLREKEQQLISTSGTSVSTLKEYDSKLKNLSESERTLTKEVNGIERQADSILRDIKDLTENEERIHKTLESYGYSSLLESFDVDRLLVELESEKKKLSGSLNTKAPETYLEISSGYRSMSTRKNELEAERHSIVKFIEEIDKDKRQTFLESYDKVDKDIREIFNKMTSGNAWPEIQNEDDIFSSGISYLVQFPNKPKRESTSISGGEKTLAAITFLLALQKLKPSPFYLLDEVDAHLDALNTERLSKILEDRASGSQMIMVSLKDAVVQKATLIYGVFPKNGVSHVVSHKISNIAQVAN